MATNRWLGGAAAVVQEDRFTPANVEIGDTFTLTATDLNNTGTTVAISFVASAATVANVTAGLTAAWNASTNALCTGVTASDQTTYLKLLADNAGVPFSVAGSATNVGGGADTQTLTRTATTANVGPNDYGTAANWSLGAVPVTTDAVVIENSTYAILYGLDQSAVDLDSLKIGRSMSGYLGQATVPLSLEFGAAGSKDVEINYWYGAGTAPSPSTRINLKLGSQALGILLHDTGSAAAAETGFPVRIVCNNSSTIITIKKGKVGIGKNYSGETATVGTINSLYTDTVATDVTLGVGSGVTLTTFNQTGGANILECGCTTLNLSGGTLIKTGSGAITTINNTGGVLTTEGTGTTGTLNTAPDATTYYGSSGTITTNNNNGYVDLTKTRVAKTITNTTIGPKATYKYNPALTTHTNPITWPTNCDLTVAAA